MAEYKDKVSQNVYFKGVQGRGLVFQAQVERVRQC